jgi:hypothetical protein
LRPSSHFSNEHTKLGIENLRSAIVDLIMYVSEQPLCMWVIELHRHELNVAQTPERNWQSDLQTFDQGSDAVLQRQLPLKCAIHVSMTLRLPRLKSELNVHANTQDA